MPSSSSPYVVFVKKKKFITKKIKYLFDECSLGNFIYVGDQTKARKAYHKISNSRYDWAHFLTTNGTIGDI